MGRLGDWLVIWEVEVAKTLRNIVLPKGESTALVDVDEICFLGAIPLLPPKYMRLIGKVRIRPEVYIVGIKDGQLVSPEIWRAPAFLIRLESVANKLIEDLKKWRKYATKKKS